MPVREKTTVLNPVWLLEPFEDLAGDLGTNG